MRSDQSDGPKPEIQTINNDGQPVRVTIALALHRAALSALAPLVAVYQTAFHQHRAAEGRRVRERRGYSDIERPDGQVVWVHAASIGELFAVRSLLARLAQGNRAVILTTNTPTSAALAQDLELSNVIHQYVPYDVPQFVARFLTKWRPELALFTESEIWPTILSELSRRHIPSVVVSGRLSSASSRKWMIMSRTARAIFGRLAFVLAQSVADGERFSQVGARHVTVTGNLKFDSPAPSYDAGELKFLQSTVGDRPVWLAASSHQGEEEIVLDAHRSLTARFPRIITILAPRYPQRGGELAALASARGLVVAQRSNGDPIAPDTAIYVADTLGELGLFYCLASVAFIGGSFVPRGGQNPLEAAKSNCAIVHGPLVRNFARIYKDLSDCGGAVCIDQANHLPTAVDKLLTDPDSRVRQVAAARQLVQREAGALERTWDFLMRTFPQLSTSNPEENNAIP